MAITENVKESWLINERINKVLLEHFTSDGIRQ
jgi:hypothetical protein